MKSWKYTEEIILQKKRYKTYKRKATKHTKEKLKVINK
jgi:hypothetical protein